jgi:hypothetical protein
MTATASLLGRESETTVLDNLINTFGGMVPRWS